MSSFSYNRGEWAELYVLAKLLCDQQICVQVHGRKPSLGEQSTPKLLNILKVTRGIGTEIEEYALNGDVIFCRHSNHFISRTEVCAQVAPFIASIKRGRGPSFPLETGDQLLTTLGITRLKRDSKLKSDIYVNAQDPMTGETGLQGYTVKALLGSKPTLFNASEPTNFTFKISPSLSQEEINRYNLPGPKGAPALGPRRIVSDLVAKGYRLTLANLDERFRENLELLDHEMPNHVGDLLLTYYSYEAGTDTSIAGNVGALANKNPQGKRNPEVLYRKKIQDLLEAAAYGMVPTEAYDGTRSAAGGLLIVERNGTLTCFRPDDKDGSRKYLFEHTALETASRQKFFFGSVERIGDATYLKLNLQIRYK